MPADQVVAARDASTEAFHLAMLGNFTLLLLGAATNWFGISNRQALVRGTTTAGDRGSSREPQPSSYSGRLRSRG